MGMGGLLTKREISVCSGYPRVPPDKSYCNLSAVLFDWAAESLTIVHKFGNDFCGCKVCKNDPHQAATFEEDSDIDNTDQASTEEEGDNCAIPKALSSCNYISVSYKKS